MQVAGSKICATLDKTLTNPVTLFSRFVLVGVWQQARLPPGDGWVRGMMSVDARGRNMPHQVPYDCQTGRTELACSEGPRCIWSFEAREA